MSLRWLRSSTVRAKVIVPNYNLTTTRGTGIEIGESGVSVIRSFLGERDVTTLGPQCGHLARGEQVVKPARSLLIGHFFWGTR